MTDNIRAFLAGCVMWTAFMLVAFWPWVEQVRG
jgi:hypothetical protein